MRITKESQLKKGAYYYYADYHNPNLEHQTECVGVYRVQYNDWREEREKEYGLAEKDERALKIDRIEFIVGRNPDSIRSASYYKLEWLYGNQKKFYDTIIEAEQDAIQMTFEYWRPFSKK